MGFGHPKAENPRQVFGALKRSTFGDTIGFRAYRVQGLGLGLRF